MTLLPLPSAAGVMARADLNEWTPPPRRAVARWDRAIRAQDDEDDATISIYDVIGLDPWTGGGVTIRQIDSALRNRIRGRDVTVNINSPGGSLFEGLAIYEALRQHKARVTVNVMALAGSAASIIAMAGDAINIAPGGFFFVHRTIGVTVGNEEHHNNSAKDLREFDGAMRGIYAARTGLEEKAVMALMKGTDDGTFMNSKTAIDEGFADGLIPVEKIEQGDPEAHKALKAGAELQSILRDAGYTRSEAIALKNALKDGTPRAADAVTPSADQSEAVTLSADEISQVEAWLDELALKIKGN